MDKYLIAALVLLVAAAVFLLVRRSRKGSACCGTPAETVRKTAVKDRNKSHYPFKTELSVGGMVCENCAAKVENALNALDGVWAKVDLGKHSAAVRTRTVPDVALLRETVSRAGYVVTEVRLSETASSDRRQA